MKNFESIIRKAYESKVNVMGWGTHGIGKTAIIEGLEEDGFYVKTIILSQSDPLVLGGYPGREELRYLNDASDAEVNDRVVEYMTTFAKPQWIIDCDDAHARGLKVLVFLDEFNRADRFALAAAMRLVNEGEISGHKVPADTVFVSACNPETENDSDLIPLNDPTKDRWCHVPIHSDAKTWLKWAKGAGVNGFVTGFVATNEDRLNAYDLGDMFDNQVMKRIKPTTRS